MVGSACLFLGLGGMVTASMVDASAAVTWFSVLALIGLGIFLLSALGKMILVIRCRVAVRRT